MANSPKQSNKKKASRRARREARAAGVPIEPPKAGGSGNIRARVSEPAPITETVKKEEIPTAPRTSARVSFSGGTTPRTDAGFDTRLATIELPAIRRDLRKLAATMAVFGLIFTGLAVVGTQTELVQRLGESLFSLWQ